MWLAPRHIVRLSPPCHLILVSALPKYNTMQIQLHIQLHKQMQIQIHSQIHIQLQIQNNANTKTHWTKITRQYIFGSDNTCDPRGYKWSTIMSQVHIHYNAMHIRIQMHKTLKVQIYTIMPANFSCCSYVKINECMKWNDKA